MIRQNRVAVVHSRHDEGVVKRVYRDDVQGSSDTFTLVKPVRNVAVTMHGRRQTGNRGSSPCALALDPSCPSQICVTSKCPPQYQGQSWCLTKATCSTKVKACAHSDIKLSFAGLKFTRVLPVLRSSTSTVRAVTLCMSCQSEILEKNMRQGIQHHRSVAVGSYCYAKRIRCRNGNGNTRNGNKDRRYKQQRKYCLRKIRHCSKGSWQTNYCTYIGLG